MDRKHRRDKRAAPQEPRHPPQHEEKQDRCCRVEEDIGEVMAAGIQPVKLAVEHVGEPGQRMPVADVAISKRPLNSPPTQALADLGIVVHISRIIVVDKLVSQCLAENHPDGQGQTEADDQA